MTRTLKSAKTLGTQFERQIANYLAQALNDDRIDRRARNGNKDRGDIAGLRIHGQRLTAECKNTTRMRLAEWADEVEIEAGNDDALAGVIIHKRHGVGNPARQWVTMTVADLAALISGERISDGA